MERSWASDNVVVICGCIMMAILGVFMLVGNGKVEAENDRLEEFLSSERAIDRDPLPMTAAVASSLDPMATGGVIISGKAKNLGEFMTSGARSAACLQYPDGSLNPEMISVKGGRVVRVSLGYDQYIETVRNSGICERITG